MSLINEIYSAGSITKGELRTFLLLLNPFAPHLTEEMWQQAGFEGYLHNASFPQYDESKCGDDMVEIVLQLSGKIKAKVMVEADISAADAIALAKDRLADALNGKTVVKEIYVPKKLVNIVAK